jgi:chromosome segregation ATPase
METTGVQDTRQRAVSLIEEAGSLLGMIPKILDENDGLRANVEAAAKESEALKGEIEALRGDLQQLRTEREDLAEIMTRIATDMSRLGEIVSRPRPAERKSPFWRDPSSPPALPTSTPPAPSLAWR